MYEIVRYYSPHLERASEVQETGLTLEEVQAHCDNPETKKNGEWFDGWREAGPESQRREQESNEKWQGIFSSVR